MKAVVIYNTRSGNTKELGGKLKEVLEKYNHECDIFRDKEIKKTPEVVKDYDFLCVGSPVHAGGPAIFPFRGLLKKISKLDLDGKRLVSFSTSSGVNAWKKVCKSIKKRLPNLDYVDSVGCVKKENEEAIKSFETIIKNL